MNGKEEKSSNETMDFSGHKNFPGLSDNSSPMHAIKNAGYEWMEFIFGAAGIAENEKREVFLEQFRHLKPHAPPDAKKLLREDYSLVDLLIWFIEDMFYDGRRSLRSKAPASACGSVEGFRSFVEESIGFTVPASIILPPSQVVALLVEPWTMPSEEGSQVGDVFEFSSPATEKEKAPHMTKFLHDIGYTLASEFMSEIEQGKMSEKKDDPSLRPGKLKTYHCPERYCGFTTTSLFQLHDHQRQPHRKGRWRCALCKDASRSHKGLEEHYLKEHGYTSSLIKEKPLGPNSCLACEFDFKSKCRLESPYHRLHCPMTDGEYKPGAPVNTFNDPNSDDILTKELWPRSRCERPYWMTLPTLPMTGHHPVTGSQDVKVSPSPMPSKNSEPVQTYGEKPATKRPVTSLTGAAAAAEKSAAMTKAVAVEKATAEEKAAVMEEAAAKAAAIRRAMKLVSPPLLDLKPVNSSTPKKQQMSESRDHDLPRENKPNEGSPLDAGSTEDMMEKKVTEEGLRTKIIQSSTVGTEKTLSNDQKVMETTPTRCIQQAVLATRNDLPPAKRDSGVASTIHRQPISSNASSTINRPKQPAGSSTISGSKQPIPSPAVQSVDSKPQGRVEGVTPFRVDSSVIAPKPPSSDHGSGGRSVTPTPPTAYLDRRQQSLKKWLVRKEMADAKKGQKDSEKTSLKAKRALVKPKQLPPGSAGSCELCGSCFLTEMALQKHKRRHLKRLEVPLCRVDGSVQPHLKELVVPLCRIDDSSGCGTEPVEPVKKRTRRKE